MTPRPAVVELVVADMAATLALLPPPGPRRPTRGRRRSRTSRSTSAGCASPSTPTTTIRSFDPGWTPPRGGHRAALAFACDSPAEVDAAWADLTAAGHEGHLEPWDAFWGMRYAVVHDPDGTPVDLFAPLPG